MIIFLDESGDLGFNFEKKSSEKFVVTLLVCDSTEVHKKITFAVRKTLKNKNKNNLITEIKGTRSDLKQKEYLYRHLPKTGWKIYTVVLHKKHVVPELTEQKNRLYNFLARFVIEKVDFSKINNSATLIIDKSKGKKEIQIFNQYIIQHLEAKLPLKAKLHIHHEYSYTFAGLQVVDSFSWGIFRKHERNDTTWYDYFKAHIHFETEYLQIKERRTLTHDIS